MNTLSQTAALYALNDGVSHITRPEIGQRAMSLLKSADGRYDPQPVTIVAIEPKLIVRTFPAGQEVPVARRNLWHVKFDQWCASRDGNTIILRDPSVADPSAPTQIKTWLSAVCPYLQADVIVQRPGHPPFEAVITRFDLPTVEVAPISDCTSRLPVDYTTITHIDGESVAEILADFAEAGRQACSNS